MTKGCFTLHWNCCEDSWKCWRCFKLFVGLLVDLLDSLKQGTTGNWILMTQMLAPANSAWLCWLSWCSGNYTVKHKQVFLLSGWTVRSWTCIHLQFVSSNNLDVETTEQFILLHTRYVCDFSVLTNFSRNSETRRKHLYRTSFTSSVFLVLTHDEFFDAFQGKKFRLNLRLFAYFKG